MGEMHAAFCLGACIFVLSALAVGAAEISSQRAPRIPINAFAAPADIISASIAPNGSRYFAIRRQENRFVLEITPIGSNGERQVFPGLRSSNYTWATWIDDQHIIASLVFTTRRSDHLSSFQRMVMIGVDSGRWAILGRSGIAYSAVSDDRIVSFLGQDPDHILMSIRRNSRDAYPGVYRVNLWTGSTRRVQRSRRPISNWFADSQGNVRLGTGYDGRNHIVHLRDQNSSSWRTLRRADVYDEPSFHPLAFSKYGDSLFVLSNHKSDRRGIFKFNLDTEQFDEKIYDHVRFDMDGAIISGHSEDLVGVSFSGEVNERIYFESTRLDMQKQMAELFPGKISRAVSANIELDRILAFARNPSGAGAYYLITPPNETITSIGKVLPSINSDYLAEMRPIKYRAPDGLTIDGYLTIPRGMTAENLPMVVFPHGGPAQRDTMEYHPFVQFLANRGYAVLQLNFRGSSGYGRRHLQAGYKQWGLAIQDDITDGTEWAIAQGIADPSRICIFGGSFGGYAALMGAVRNPSLYRCAVSLNGVTDIQLWMKESERREVKSVLKMTIGDRSSERARLKETSPVFNAAKIRIPVLIVHGENDRTVSVTHAHRMVRAMREAGGNTQTVLIDGADHSLSNPSHRARFMRVLEEFLEYNMGPVSGQAAFAPQSDRSKADTG